jgi:hypothetical protein
MVGTLKRWLGIAELENDVKRLNDAQPDAKKALETALDCKAVYEDHENRLTSIESQPKIDVKVRARTVPFRQFKSVAEALPEE